MNKRRCNLHTHTVYSDGHNKAEEFVVAAIEKGFASIGFSEHTYTPYDAACCVKEAEMPLYFAEIRSLKEKYSDQIEILLGLEGDSYHPTPVDQVEYMIGSVHYLRDDTGEYYTIDHLPEFFESALQKVSGGDMQDLVARYYKQICGVLEREHPDIVGHLDLITKLNIDNRYFNPSEPWYRAILEETIAAIRKSGSIVEVNTGGIYRGYTSTPYPGEDTLRLLHAANIPVIISSDAHCVEALDFWFDEAEKLICSAGYREIISRRDGQFISVSL